MTSSGLREENNTILKLTLIADKFLLLLEDFRNNLNQFQINCKCDENIKNKSKFSELQNEFVCVFDEYNQNKPQINDQLSINIDKCQNDSKAIGTIGTYVCRYKDCDFKSSSSYSYRRHINSIHLSKSPLNCDDCGLQFWTIETYNEHLNLVHHKTDYDGLEEISCSKCERKFSSKNRLRSHMALAHKTRLKYYKCDWGGCRFISRHLNGLNMHKTKHYDDNRVSNQAIGHPLPDNDLKRAQIADGSFKNQTTIQELKTNQVNDDLVSVEILDICLDKVSFSESKSKEPVIDFNPKQVVDKKLKEGNEADRNLSSFTGKEDEVLDQVLAYEETGSSSVDKLMSQTQSINTEAARESNVSNQLNLSNNRGSNSTINFSPSQDLSDKMTTSMDNSNFNSCPVKDQDRSEQIIPSQSKQAIEEITSSSDDDLMSETQRYDKESTLEFANFVAQEFNKKSTTSEPFVYHCDYPNCDYKTSQRERFSHHRLVTHFYKSQLKCHKCRLTFSGKMSLDRHMNLVHRNTSDSSNNSFKCHSNGCSFESNSLVLLNQHKRQHLNENIDKIITEFKTGINKSESESNVNEDFFINAEEFLEKKTDVEMEQNSDSVEENDVCLDEGPLNKPKQSSNQNIIAMNLSENDSMNASKNANNDQFIFGSNLFSKKRLQGLKSLQESSGLKVDNVLNDGTSQSGNTAKKLNDLDFKCDKCTREYATRYQLTRHMARIHMNPKFRCVRDECEYQTNDKNNFKRHVRRHGEDKPYRCLEMGCDKHFSSVSNLNRHIRTHTRKN